MSIMDKGYTCPHCGKPIYDEEALMCLYCGESLERGAGFLGGLKYSEYRIVSFVLVLLAVIVLLFFILN
jgi:hypothetical protein